ncbi:hypothetical protein IWX50DRAFT_89790 [Phyllosticta citricarpa]
MRSCGFVLWGGGGGGWPRSTPHPPVAKRRGGNARHLATSLPVNRLEDQSEDGGSLVAVRLGERAGGRRLAARGKRYLTCSCPRGGWKRVACGVEEGKRRRRSFFAPLPVPVILFIAHLTERAFDHLEAVPLCPSLYTVCLTLSSSSSSCLIIPRTTLIVASLFSICAS